MRFGLCICGLVALVAGCSPAAPATPTNAPAPQATVALAPSPSAAPKPAVASPSASAAPSPSAAPGLSPAPSPSAAASPSPAPVNTALLFSGTPTPSFTLQSSAFTSNGNIPADFSCDGANGGQSPPISWTGAPSTARAFALVDQDADGNVGGGALVTHWVVYNIPSTVTQLDQGLPPQPTLSNGAMQGLNVRRAIGYMPVCPPAGAPAHHYTFQLYALDGTLPLQPGASIIDLQNAMRGHVVGQTELVALFGH